MKGIIMRFIHFLVIIVLMIISTLGGYIYGSDVTRCQKIVVQDISDHQHFTSQLAKLVDGDLMNALTTAKH